MAFNLPAPINQSDFLAEILRRRLETLQKPAPWETLAPAVSGAVGNISQGVTQGIKNRSVKDAQELASEYQTLPQEVKELPGVKSKYNEALFTLGMKPTELTQKDPATILAEALAKQTGTNRANIETPVPVKPKFGELNQQQQTAIDSAMAEGRLVPSQISRGPKLVAIANQLLSNPTYNAAEQDINFAAGKTKRTATAGVQGKKGYETAASLGTLEDVLSAAEPLVAKLTPTSLDTANAAFQKGLAHTNDRDANQLLVHMNEAAGLYSQILMGGGTPTDQARNMAHDVIRQGMNPEGFGGMREALLIAGRSRAGRLTGQISNESIGKAKETPQGRKARLLLEIKNAAK